MRPMRYNPASFAHGDLAACREIIAAHPFGTLITSRGAEPVVTHCPMVWVQDEHDPASAWIDGHIARPNTHHEHFDGGLALACFVGAHSYVSPTWYSERKNVPTWNYIAVHVTGTIERVDELPARDAVLKRLIGHMEPSYIEHWKGLPEDYQQRMLGGIVGFRLRVQRVEGKFKLSQNRQPADRDGVLAAMDRHAEQGDGDARELAAWMRRLTG